MRLFEAIVEANHRAIAGDKAAGLHPLEHSESLPIAGLTCIDARLNAFFPGILGVPNEQFIWLRNAGNIITGATSSTIRSLALACAVKGAREIAIIGHTDCQVCKTSMMQLTNAFQALGVNRAMLPENLTEFFGLFASERQNVSKAVDFVRQSPLIGRGIPVHGLLVDINTGNLEWLVNGYQSLDTTSGSPLQEAVDFANQKMDAFKGLEDFKLGEMKFPESQIGEVVTKTTNLISEETKRVESKVNEISAPPPINQSNPRRIPIPPPIRPKFKMPKK
ncbi:carbonic anhydrase [Pedosphaera parvula]|uniref:Carbonic anhydrase n=1 Tax=Pedosphaera parvula (strain Ellin514) TaxID=320771 RepID=B9XG82_PEDPL|nr:carbonic anhydrase [Pedosphaera parvula]EEF61244.1 carbonic anhydrase [Pedosphaera parvula Ellin514]